MKYNFYLLVLLLLQTRLFAQDESWKLYDDSHIARVDITIDPDTLEWIYNNGTSPYSLWRSINIISTQIWKQYVWYLYKNNN